MWEKKEESFLYIVINIQIKLTKLKKKIFYSYKNIRRYYEVLGQFSFLFFSNFV